MAGGTGSKAKLLRGGCLCGRVEYAVEDAFAYAMNCHCSNCRRATGSAFKPFAGIGMDRLNLVRGQEALLVYGDPAAAHDLHCATCGSLLYSVLDRSRRAHIAMGTLIDAPSIRPGGHIFVGSKAAWHDITDDLPQYHEFPED